MIYYNTMYQHIYNVSTHSKMKINSNGNNITNLIIIPTHIKVK